MSRKPKKKKESKKILDIKFSKQPEFLQSILEAEQKPRKIDLEEKPKELDSELEEIIRAVEDVKKQDKQIETKYQPLEIKTNYNTSAESYQSQKVSYEGLYKIGDDKHPIHFQQNDYRDIETSNAEQLTYEDIERITKQDIVNSVLGLEKWNNISPHEREDYENWRKLSPGAKILWWSLVQTSGYGIKDLDSV